MCISLLLYALKTLMMLLMLMWVDDDGFDDYDKNGYVYTDNDNALILVINFYDRYCKK